MTRGTESHEHIWGPWSSTPARHFSTRLCRSALSPPVHLWAALLLVSSSAGWVGKGIGKAPEFRLVSLAHPYSSDERWVAGAGGVGRACWVKSSCYRASVQFSLPVSILPDFRQPSPHPVRFYNGLVVKLESRPPAGSPHSWL